MSTACEKCGLIPEVKYASGRFCSQSCARSFATSKSRSLINEKVKDTLKGRVGVNRGKKIPKTHTILCSICQTTVETACKNRSYCDNHPGGKEKLYSKPEIVVRSPEENALFLKRSEASKLAWTKEKREEARLRMRQIASSKPESYNSSNRGRTKCYTIDGLKFHGTWEVEFYIHARDANLNPIRPMSGFPYTWEDTIRTYYPDFYLPKHNVYVEIKGYETDKDRAKWISFPHKLIILKSEEITSLKNKSKSILEVLSKFIPPP